MDQEQEFKPEHCWKTCKICKCDRKHSIGTGSKTLDGKNSFVGRYSCDWCNTVSGCIVVKQGVEPIPITFTCVDFKEL